MPRSFLRRSVMRWLIRILDFWPNSINIGCSLKGNNRRDVIHKVNESLVKRSLFGWMNHCVEKKRWLAGLMKGDLLGRTSGQQPNSQEIAAFSLKVDWEQSHPNTFQAGRIKKDQLPKQPGCPRGGWGSHLSIKTWSSHPGC